MNTGEKLAWLIAHSCIVSIEANNHRSNYVTVAQEFESSPECYSRVPDDIKSECIRRDSLIEVLVYNMTPVGCYAYYHYDIDAAIGEAYDFLSHGPDRMFKP